MGDLSAEPSMEEILSSIKRIIAEEGDGAPQRLRRPGRNSAFSPPPERVGDDEVLELNEPLPAARAEPAPRPEPTPAAEALRLSEVKPVMPERSRIAEPARGAEPILGREAADASRGALEALGRMLVKPEPGNDGTLEALVREMLRPMLREWLDANLPQMVEQLVSREIARIAGQA